MDAYTVFLVFLVFINAFAVVVTGERFVRAVIDSRPGRQIGWASLLALNVTLFSVNLIRYADQLAG